MSILNTFSSITSLASHTITYVIKIECKVSVKKVNKETIRVLLNGKVIFFVLTPLGIDSNTFELVRISHVSLDSVDVDYVH